MAKRETGKQRRARLIKEGLCTNCAKRKAAPKPKSEGGFYAECGKCRAYFKAWEAKNRKAEKAPAHKRKAAPKKERRPHVLGSNPVTVKEITTGAADLLGVKPE